jgi:adenylyltransferase/sulfurtransferase
VFWGARGPCYRCLYPETPPTGSVPSCAEAGVFGVLPGIIGTVQAAEAIKLILGRGEPLLGRMLVLDALEMRFRDLRLRKDPACPCCGEVARAGAAPGENRIPAVPEEELAVPSTEFDLDVRELKRRLDEGQRPLLVDVRTPLEWEICRLEGARLVPLQELASRLHEIDAAREIVLYCHVGVRSALATQILVRHGFPRVRNLAGGIDAWAAEVDPSTARY